MPIRLKQKTQLIFIVVIAIFLLHHQSSYLMFLISRGWYEWVTMSSKSDAIEVNVVDMSIIEKMDVKDVNKYISKAYLG